MNPNRLAPIIAVLLLLFVAQGCRSSSISDWTPDQLARRERLVFLTAKAAGAVLVEKNVAKAADLAKAADIIEAAALSDLPGALKAAGYVDAQWELFALLVQDQLEPFKLQPFVEVLVSAAARGVREGATGIPENEKVELRELEAEPPAAPAAVGALGGREVPGDGEPSWSRSNLGAGCFDRAGLDEPVAGLVELVRGESVLDAA